MKNERQEKILSIIAEEEIDTQEQLLERLEQYGFTSTQATISRDIKQLHLIKEPIGGGRYRYAVSAHKTKLNFVDRLQTILRESILSVDHASNLVVLKTMPGLAGAAGAAFDSMGIGTMLGSLAGDDTVLIIMRDEDSAAEFCRAAKEMQR